MTQRIAIFGSGAVGCYVGGTLQHAGAQVVFIGSERMRKRVMAEGLTLSDLRGERVRIAPAQVAFTVDSQALAGADLVLVCVKSGATGQAAAAIRQFAPATALVLSLQNGIGNAEAIAAINPGLSVLGVMVPFNIANLPDGGLHRATGGDLMVEASPHLAPWLTMFAGAGLPLTQRQDFLEVQWGKLLLNLNNPVNALSGLPLQSELGQRAYRRCLALLIREALGVLHAAGIAPARIGNAGPAWLPVLLELPDWLFHRVAGQMLRIDPQARSSMWDDLHAGRRTEIDFLSGAVVALAQAHGHDAPFNRRVTALVHQAGTTMPFQAIDGVRLERLLVGSP
jgi:2-dehydropantoate 2-reductase